jgi:hypothetical protein
MWPQAAAGLTDTVSLIRRLSIPGQFSENRQVSLLVRVVGLAEADQLDICQFVGVKLACAQFCFGGHGG